MNYPQDNFYKGYSLSFDLSRSGEQEFKLAKTRLEKFGLATNTKIIELSLNTIRDIHELVRDNGQIEKKSILAYRKEKKLTSGVIPIDLTMSYDIFTQIMTAAAPFIIASEIGDKMFSIVKKIKNAIKKQNTGDVIETQNKKALLKIIKKDSDDKIIKNVINITINGNKVVVKSKSQSKPKTKPKSKSTKKSKPKKTTHK